VFREVAGEAAVFFDPARPEAIARAIETILDDAGVRDKLVTAGRAQSRRFDWLDTARGYLEAYRAAHSAGPMAN
jgi:glycosyltransferase involved in cell wall biosynthesis